MSRIVFPFPKNRPCIKCGTVERARGLCTNHYAQAHRKVQSERLTWAVLEDAGECLRHWRNASPHPLYRVWRNMHERCANPWNHRFKDYGGRGIAVCERWAYFDNFVEDMGAPPADGMQIDRIDNDLGYMPFNCKWATLREQQSHTRRTTLIETPYGQMTVSEAARHYGMPLGTLDMRLRRGWSVERALTPPRWVHPRRKWKAEREAIREHWLSRSELVLR